MLSAIQQVTSITEACSANTMTNIFANPYDYNKLYVMNSDCTNAMKLMMTVLHQSMSVAVTYIMSRIISSRKPSEQYSGDSYSVFTAVT